MSKAIDSEYSLQDVVRCHLCETPVPPLHCDVCHIHLCKDCVVEHLSEESKGHKVVLFKKQRLTPKCSKHPTKICNLYCEQCEIPICVECVSSFEHLGHRQVSISKILDTKKEALRRDLQELENIVYPNYQEIASNITVQKADLHKNCQELTTAIDKHGEDFHREVDNAIKKLKSDVGEIECKHLVVLNEEENNIKTTLSEITQSISNLNKLLNSNHLSIVSTYKSRNAEFIRLFIKLTVSLPRFNPQKINKEQIYQQIGFLTALSIKTEEHVYTRESSGTKSSPPGKPFVNEPQIISDINTEYGESNILRSVSCLSGNEVWTCGHDNIMRLYNLKSELVKSIQTKSGERPGNVAVTQSGELIYTDFIDGTVNIVKKTQIQTVIRLKRWTPLFVCSTSSGDLLVIMNSNGKKQTKLVRYSGATEKQTIQYNDKGQPLYSPYPFTKYISENKNQDICVADYTARALVVVNQAGKLRFTYTGPPCTTKEPFRPIGLTTDSQSRILTADFNNNGIHILNQDGQFLRYIYNCHFQRLFDLCVDTKDNLFVAVNIRGEMKRIQYYM